MAGAEGAALAARGLRKRYKEVVAVDGVDLTVARGECFALLGPNGAGKTTTVEMLEGLTPPDAGTIELLGRPLTGKTRRAVMERVGVQLQETNLYKRFTVGETLELFASFFEKTVPTDTILARLALTEKKATQLRHLSGGQKQRVYLGAALVNDPDLLFLDEPTTGLDPQARRAMWELLAGLKAEGKSILLTTHYMEEAEVLADRVAIVDHGKVIAEGTPRQLVRDVAGEQVLRLTLATPEARAATLPPADARERLAARLPWMRDAIAVDDGLEITTADVAARMQDVFGAAAASGLVVTFLEMRRSTLEDVFLKLTGRSIRNG